MTMLRFERCQKVGFREYMRSDGTRSYFFCLDSVRGLFRDAGFLELELEYCCIKSVNRCNGKTMRRVWVHGKFQKPMQIHIHHNIHAKEPCECYSANLPREKKRVQNSENAKSWKEEIPSLE